MDSPQQFIVDAEHSALRLAVTLAFFGIGVALFLLLSILLPGDWTVVNLAVSIGAAWGGSTLIERALKGRWHSGRVLSIDAAGVRVMKRETLETAIDAAQPVDVLRWQFESRGRGRLPKGWRVVACALVQDDRQIAAYAFASPANWDAQPQNDRFKALQADRSGAPGTAGTANEVRLAGAQRRLHEAESFRWQHGAEMSWADFVQFLDRVDRIFSA